MSLEYLALCDGFTSSHHRTMERLFQAISAATADQSRARAAAILIQRHWRGYRDRAYINFLHSCALRIQCCYRAHIGRIRFRHHQQHYLEQQQHAYYHIQATLIQKIFRGYYSRKYAQDFHQRKAYIRTVQQKGEDLHQRMESTYQQQVRDSIMARQHSDEAQFTHLTENIHHLISTKAIPGVFGPKMGMGEESKTMAYEKPMEDHIKDAFVNRQQRLKTLRESMVLPGHHHHRPTSDDLSHSQSPSHSSTLPSSSSRHNPRGSSIRAVLENGRREISNTSTRTKWDQSSHLSTTSASRQFISSASATSLLSHTISVEEKEDIHHEKEMNGTSTRAYPTSVGPVQIRRKWAHPIGSPLNGLTKGTTTLPSQPHPPSQPHRPSKLRTRPQSQPQPQLAQ